MMYIVEATTHGIRNSLSTFNYNVYSGSNDTFNYDVYSGSNMVSEMVYQHSIIIIRYYYKVLYIVEVMRHGIRNGLSTFNIDQFFVHDQKVSFKMFNVKTNGLRSNSIDTFCHSKNPRAIHLCVLIAFGMGLLPQFTLAFDYCNVY